MSKETSVSTRSIEAVADASGAVANKQVDGYELLVSPEPRATLAWIGDRYQSRRSEFLADWEGEFLKLAVELRGRKGLDSQVKLMLIQHVLVGACEGSQTLSRYFANDLRAIKEVSKTQDRWFIASSPNESLDPRIEQTVIPKLGMVYRLRATIDGEGDATRKLQCEWIGILTRTGGTMDVHLNTDKPLSGRLLVMREASTLLGAVDWIEIGTITNGKVSLSGPRVEQVAGRPVFLCP